MSDKNSLANTFSKGLWKENPVFKQLLGMCPTLAVTNTALNGLAMGLATTFVLVCSSIMVALVKNLIPRQVRIASYIVIIATFVTMADMVLAALFPAISAELGPYVPLIVVNCLILSRQEAFASKNNVGRSFVDAAGMSTGFVLALLALSSTREILGVGELFGHTITGGIIRPWLIMVLPGGAFLTLGVLVGIANHISTKLRVS
ncbi:MAG: electron transport complex subunit RsxE [bacterium]